MNRILSTILAGIAFLCAVFAPGAAHAQATGDGGATVEIQTPVTSTKRSDLDFGTIHNAADGTVRIDPATGVLTTTGGAMPIGSLTSRAHFVTDRPGLSFVYIQYDPTVTMTPVDGVGDPIVVNLEFAMTNRIFGWNSGAGQYALVAGPEQNYYIGGSFALPATQVDGAYESTFEFIVDNP